MYFQDLVMKFLMCWKEFSFIFDEFLDFDLVICIVYLRCLDEVDLEFVVEFVGMFNVVE